MSRQTETKEPKRLCSYDGGTSKNGKPEKEYEKIFVKKENQNVVRLRCESRDMQDTHLKPGRMIICSSVSIYFPKFKI